MCGARVVFQTPRRFPPVQNREAEIHQDDVRRMLGRMRQRIGAIARLDHVEARQLELLRVHLAQLGLIFDEQNQRLDAIHRSIITRPSGGDDRVNRTIQMIVSRVT